MIRHIVQKIIHRRFWVVLLILVVTAFFAAQIRNLRIVIDPSAMLPKQHPNVVGTTTAETLFGSKYVVVIGVTAADGGTAMRPEVLQVVSALSRDLATVPGVKAHTLLSVTSDRAKSISGSDGELKVQPMLRSPIDRGAITDLLAHLKDNPLYQNTIVSNDQTVASVSFSVNVGPKGFREVMDKVQVVVEKAQSPVVTITQSGTAVFFANVERFSQRMAFLFPIALILIGLIHFEAFRTFQGLILPLVTAILAVIWGLGIMGASNVPLDAFNATTPILILAVAAGHAVQILKRYYEEYDKARAHHPDDPLYAQNDRAIVESMTHVAPVMIAAGLVAALGFFSLITFQIATIRTFGIFTGLGILSALLIELTFIPALRSYMRAPKAISQATAEDRLWDRIALALTAKVILRHRRIVAGFLVVGVLAGLGMSNVNRENSTKSYFGENLKVRQEDRFLNDRLAGTNTLYVVFQADQADKMKDPVVLRVIEGAQKFIATLPGVGKTISIVDLVKQMNRSMNAGNVASNVIPASQDLVSQYLLLYSMSGQPTDFDAYIDYDYRNANLIVWMKDDSSKYAESMVSRIRNFIEPTLPKGVSITIGGSVPQTSALSETLVDGKIRNVIQMIVFVLVAGTIVFRSFLAGLYLILPLIFAVLVNFGVMGLTGIPLNTPNSVSSAMAIGIGADYAIYLLYRIREELRVNGDVDVALREAMKSAGKAVIYVASAISGGYAVLMLSFNFYVHIWLGLLIVLSMIVSAASALILIPALIKIRRPRFLRQSPGEFPDARNGALASPLALLGATIGMGALVCLALVGSTPAVAQEIGADEVMERNYLSTRLESSISEATFRLVSANGQERVRKTYGVTKLQRGSADNRRVIRFLSPSDVRNTTTQLVEHSDKDDEIWVYLPALKKARRLASDNKKNSFVGTDLSYGDIVGHKARDWNHKIARQESLNGIATWVVESTPKSPEIAATSGYSKRVNWVSRENFVSAKSEFHDIAGALLKTIENTNIVLVDQKQKKYQAMQVQVRNHQTGHSTLLKLDRFEANVPVAESYFGNAYLEKEE